MGNQIESVSSVKQTTWNPATLQRLQREYLELVPHIRRRAAYRFRFIRCPHQHADMVAEAVGLGWKMYLRLHERGIDLTAWHKWFTYVAAHAVLHHRVAGYKRDMLDRGKQVLTTYACRQDGRNLFPPRFLRAAVTKPGNAEEAYKDTFIPDEKTDIPGLVAFKVDWEEFRKQLSPAEQHLVDTLARCIGVGQTAKVLGYSEDAVSYRRDKIAARWDAFQNE
jgi:hypothetical protein